MLGQACLGVRRPVLTATTLPNDAFYGRKLYKNPAHLRGRHSQFSVPKPTS